MRHAKRLTAISLAVVMTMALAACGGDTKETVQATEKATEAETEKETEKETVPETETAAEEAEARSSVEIVTVEGGRVQGVESDTPGVLLFKGIPCAADTSGENRWKEPQPVEPWEGVKVCDEWGDQAMQRTAEELNPVGTIYGDEFYFDEAYDPAISENGLNLNVYTPAKTPEDNLPVLVWIHGGANNHGHASEMEFNASKLADKGIIVVSIQYRMGMFGFLTLPGFAEENEHGVSGNYAVLDMIKALHWVQDNIAGFGGNPGQVTIAGQSAGGYNVSAILRTPLSKGLFQNAVVQSQTAFMPAKGSQVYSSMEEKQEEAEPIVKAALGLPEDASSAAVAAELRSHDAEYFMTTKSASNPEEDLFDTITNINGGFAYVLDGYVFTEESVDLTRPGALDGINMMVGCTSNEMGSFGADPNGTMDLEEFAKNMTETYGEDYKKAYDPKDEKEAYVMDMRSSSDSWLGSFREMAGYLNANNDMDVYTYFFDQNMASHENAPDDEFYGCFHSTELWYTFNSMRDVEGQRKWTAQDHALADEISTYYANFVKTGNPNGEGLAEWAKGTREDDIPFMWWHDGTSECITGREGSEKDAINLKAAAERLNFD